MFDRTSRQSMHNLIPCTDCAQGDPLRIRSHIIVVRNTLSLRQCGQLANRVFSPRSICIREASELSGAMWMQVVVYTNPRYLLQTATGELTTQQMIHCDKHASRTHTPSITVKCVMLKLLINRRGNVYLAMGTHGFLCTGLERVIFTLLSNDQPFANCLSHELFIRYFGQRTHPC